METVSGSTRDGSEREVSCWVKDGQLYLWIHQLSARDGGIEIHVAPDKLFAALVRALISPDEHGVDEPDGG